ncbi:hypothetical protein BD408DRAFT_471420 [Parasitella parasitica]|nr:hypothetical protein BD408DRAFT_471420 [Parasitella parasitica]
MTEISVLNKTRKGRRRLFSDEKKLKAKYEEKGNNTNVSRKRISQLVNIARSALFATQDITDAYLQVSSRQRQKAWKTNFEEQKQCYEKVEDAQERDKTSDLTKTWKAKVEEKDERYRNVEAVKLRKRGLMVVIRDTKERLQSLRREIYEYGKPLVDDLKNLIPFKPFTVGSKGCCRKVEECKLDEDMDLTTAVFSGTDNGIIKTTITPEAVQ